MFLIIVLFAFGCDGGPRVTPGDACEDLCDRIDECEPTDASCNGLCGIADDVEGEDDDCDHALIEFIDCFTALSCELFQMRDAVEQECEEEEDAFEAECITITTPICPGTDCETPVINP